MMMSRVTVMMVTMKKRVERVCCGGQGGVREREREITDMLSCVLMYSYGNPQAS